MSCASCARPTSLIPYVLPTLSCICSCSVDLIYLLQIYLTVTPSSIHLKPYHPSMLPVPPTETTPSLPYPIQLVPVTKIQYYEQPQGPNIMGLFKNPMVLMLGFTGLMAFAMPKMLVRSDFPPPPLRMLICCCVCAMQASMDLDPEEAKEMAQMQQRIKGFQNTDWSEKYV